MAAKFYPEAAMAYANSYNWKLPNKLKDDKTLQEIVQENISAAVAEIPEEERYECDRCGSVVQEPDIFCWFCGADTSEDGTGGFKAAEKDSEESDEPATDEPATEKDEATDEPEEEEKPKAKKEKAKKEKTKKTKPSKVEEEIEEASEAVVEEASEAVVEEASEAVVEAIVGELVEEPEEPEEKADSNALIVVGGSGFKTLKEYTNEIRSLNANTGLMAWRIGRLLTEVKATKQFKDGYGNMADYVAQEIGYSWQQARNFMRYAQVVEQDQAAKLGIYKLEILARSPDDSKERMLKAALPKDAGGQGLNRDQLEKRLKVEKEKYKGREKSPRGRKAEPNKKLRVHDLIGSTIEIKTDSDGEGEEVIPDTLCFIEVKVLKSKVRISFVEGAVEEE